MQDTFTNLNYDLVMTESVSLDQPTKDILTAEAVTLVEDAAYLVTLTNFSAFKEKNRYK